MKALAILVMFVIFLAPSLSFAQQSPYEVIIEPIPDSTNLEITVKGDIDSERVNPGKVLLKEKYNIIFKEDMSTTSASGSFTTLLSGTLYTAAIENIISKMKKITIATFFGAFIFCCPISLNRSSG